MFQERQRGGYRRSKERYVSDAIECVQRWRDIFENGLNDEGGNLRKYTLVQAAEIVQIPKKTLEDYYSIIRKASQIVDLNRVLDKKMGYLRNLIKQFKSTGAVQSFPSTNELEMKDEDIQEEKIVQNELAECFHNQNDWNDMIIEEEDQPIQGFIQSEVNEQDELQEYFWEDNGNNLKLINIQIRVLIRKFIFSLEAKESQQKFSRNL